MDDYLTLACERLGVEVRQVLSHKIYPDEDVIALVIDKGIAGCPKYQLSLSGLLVEEPTPVEPEKKTEPKTDFKALPLKELKAIAKELGIKGYGSMKRETLLSRIAKRF